MIEPLATFDFTLFIEEERASVNRTDEVRISGVPRGGGGGAV